jgi:hypothetical protein
MNKFKRIGKGVALAFSGVGALVVGAAAKADTSAVAAAIQTQATSSAADVGTAGVAIMGVVVAIAAVAWIRRVVK